MQKAMMNRVETKKSLADLKICHIIIDLSSIGGAERMLVRLLLANRETVKNQVVLVFSHAGALGQQLRQAGVTVHEFGMETFWDIPHVIAQLKRYISSFNPDIVQTWMYHADLLGGVVAYLSGYKNIIWGIRRTSLCWSDSKNTLLVMKICALISHWVPKKIISVAEAGKQAHAQSGYSAERITVIPNGFDFENLVATSSQRNAFRKEYNFLDDDIVIGCLGRFNHAKGQDNFVKAAGIVAQHHPKAKFLLVGKDCDSHNVNLTAWIQEFSLQDKVVLLGERSDVPVCLAAMDVYCMPSRTEGFPNSLGEAMYMSLPCVATDVGDTKVLAGDTAVLVPAQDEKALAQALLDLIKLPKEQRDQMGSRAKLRVITEFSIEKACERFNTVYEEIIT